MKQLTAFLLLSFMLLTLSACNNGTEIIQEPTDLSQQSDHAVVDSEIAKNSENSSTQNPTAADNKNDDNHVQDESFTLDEFRNAIDTVVQDSIQEDVEKAVEDEVAKKTEKQE